MEMRCHGRDDVHYLVGFCHHAQAERVFRLDSQKTKPSKIGKASAFASFAFHSNPIKA